MSRDSLVVAAGTCPVPEATSTPSRSRDRPPEKSSLDSELTFSLCTFKNQKAVFHYPPFSELVCRGSFQAGL